MKTLSLAICRCPHGIWSVSLDALHSSTRLTPQKHCGRWDTIQSWNLNEEQLMSIANEIQCQVDQLSFEEDLAPIEGEKDGR